MTRDQHNKAKTKKSAQSVDLLDNPSRESSPASCSSTSNANGEEGTDEDMEISLNTIFMEIKSFLTRQQATTERNQSRDQQN